jgi:hypothetical protein
MRYNPGDSSAFAGLIKPQGAPAMRYLVAACIAVSLLFSALDDASAQQSTRSHWQVGRYQLETDRDGTVYLLDTMTGQCWSKVRGGRWTDEGNPTMLETSPAAEKPLKLDLPKDVVQLTIRQRRTKFIPGSENRGLRIDDITGGQVVISVHDDQGNTLLDDVSCKPGDIRSFQVGEQTYFVHLKELQNFLVGDDLAILELATDHHLLHPIEAQIDIPPDVAPDPKNR